MEYIDTFPYEISGIPCIIGVNICVPEMSTGSIQYEIDYDILDRKMYPAPWLENKETYSEHDDICEIIIERNGEE